MDLVGLFRWGNRNFCLIINSERLLMLRRERRSIGNTPREVCHQHRGFHLQPEVCEHGAEMLPSGLILQKKPTDKVVNVDMEMTFPTP